MLLFSLLFSRLDRSNQLPAGGDSSGFKQIWSNRRLWESDPASFSVYDLRGAHGRKLCLPRDVYFVNCGCYCGVFRRNMKNSDFGNPRIFAHNHQQEDYLCGITSWLSAIKRISSQQQQSCKTTQTSPAAASIVLYSSLVCLVWTHLWSQKKAGLDNATLWLAYWRVFP